MEIIKKYYKGIILAIILAVVGNFLSQNISNGIVGAGVFALIIGMFINPLIHNNESIMGGIKFTSSRILKTAIIFMGASLSISQVLSVGKISLLVMIFTLFTAFVGGYFIGKLFKMDWKLSSLISAGTGICGGSAIAALAPTIKAKTTDVAYAISSTFLFDVVMVIIFPIMGRYFGMNDFGFGLWTGTAVNDTSSVVAAAYAFSDAAGQFAIIVKLTRTLSIIPVVLIFSYIRHKTEKTEGEKVKISTIFPFFILIFLLMVVLRSVGFISPAFADILSNISKFLMVMSLGAIGLNTSFKEVYKSGFLPMLHGFIISALVVIVSFVVQMAMGML